MPVDPHIAGLLELIAAADRPMHTMSPQEARESFRTLTVLGRRPQDVVPVASVEDVTVPGGDGELAARVYRPEADGPLPTVVLLHGGGWVIGDLETHDNTARHIATGSRAVVLSVAYRLAPEAPFPAAVDDAVAAVRWASDHLDELGGTDVLAVAGDSAGGNLSAVVAQTMPDRVAAQLLIYPGTDVTADLPSRSENGTGYFLETPTMEWFFAQYAGHLGDPTDVRLSPLLAEDLSNQPPAVVVTAELDPLRDEGEAYAHKLEDAGIDVVLTRYPSLVHGFFDMGPASPAAHAAVVETCARFGDLLAKVAARRSTPTPGGP